MKKFLKNYDPNYEDTGFNSQLSVENYVENYDKKLFKRVIMSIKCLLYANFARRLLNIKEV